MEALSRIVLRLDPKMISDALDIALLCYHSQSVIEHTLLGQPLQNLIERAWNALPNNLRHERVFDLLKSPIVGTIGYAASSECADPGSSSHLTI